MRLNTFVKIGSVLLLTGFIAACGSNSSSSAQPKPVAAATLESKFGTEFAMIFDAASTAQPTPLDAGSVPVLAPADQPIPFPS